MLAEHILIVYCCLIFIIYLITMHGALVDTMHGEGTGNVWVDADLTGCCNGCLMYSVWADMTQPLRVTSTSSLSLLVEHMFVKASNALPTHVYNCSGIDFIIFLFLGPCFLWLISRGILVDKHAWGRQAFSLTSTNLGILSCGHSSLLVI